MKEQIKKEKRSRTLVTMIFILVALIIAISGGIYVCFNNLSIGEFNKEDKVLETNYLLELDEFKTNLKSDNNGKHYIKAKVYVGYSEEKDLPKIENEKAKIQDVVNGKFLNSTVQNLRSENIEKLKEDTVKEINKTLNNSKITGVYITELITQ